MCSFTIIPFFPLSCNCTCFAVPETTEECLQQKWNPSSLEEAKEFTKLIADGTPYQLIDDRYSTRIADDAVRFEKGVERFATSNNLSTFADLSSTMTAKDIVRLQSNDTYMPYAGNCSDIQDVDRYRTFNGLCNNKRHPNWGATHRPLLRWEPHAYGGEGYNTPVTQRDGKDLPNPRKLSRYLHRSNDTPADTQQNTLFMLWGQFLSHDLQQTPQLSDKDSICRKSCNTTAEHCFNIKISHDDPQFGSAQSDPKLRRDCLPFVRSAPTHQYSSDSLFPREQFTTVTSYMDASNVYGTSEYQAQRLRTMKDGKLMTAIGNNLPFDCGVSKRCVGSLPLCFLAGTGTRRVSMHVMMVVMNTLWVREHNRIVSELKKLNPTWNDETLYQEGRKIVGALIQKITYSEYAPQLLGKFVFGRIMKKHCGYEDDVEAGIYNEFVTAAFRFGHSQVVSKIARVDDQYNTLSVITLQQAFFQPERYYERDGLFDNYMRGLLARQSLRTDRFLSDQVTDHLFQPVNSTHPGFDLAAINIQRGRDHGLQSYREYSLTAGIKLAFRGSFLPNPMFTLQNHQLIEKVYDSIDNCDLWPCGLLERPLETAFPVSERTGSQLGPTFSLIIAEQLARLRDGDRFFYKNPGVFSTEQLAAIEKVTMSAVICANSNISTIQPSAFSHPIRDNKAISCAEVEEKQRLDLTPWSESHLTNTLTTCCPNV